MTSHIFAALVTAATVILSVGCSTPMSQPSTSSSGAPASSYSASPSSGATAPGYEEQTCQVFRSYVPGRSVINVMEECARQMGVDACRQCLGTP